jgi:fumarate reductase flavoprotein subunit
MAGLVAAAEARRLGAAAEVHEKLDRPGGSMRLSSGVIWRHRSLEVLLDSLGAPVVSRDTGNPLTTGVRFDPEGLTEALLAAAGPVQLSSPLRELPEDEAVVLATGGFAGDTELVREHVTPEADHLLLRAAPGSTGDGLRLGLAAGAQVGAGLDQVYARAMPAPPARVKPAGFVRLAQLYARHAEVTNERGERYETATWSEIDTAQWMARQPRARAWFRVPRAALGEMVRDRTVAEMVDAAEEAGAPVRRDAEHVTVETVAGITTTLGGLKIDRAYRAAPGLFACGADAGGIATGGYASGLAAALVFGRIAARAALGESP